MERIIFAHRGLSHRAPENTMAAFRLAHESGCTWIETDVDVISGAIPVILHDSTLDRTTDQTGSMYDAGLEDIAKADAGAWFSPQFSGERIPTLHEFIDFLNETGMNANIELKSHERGLAGARQLVDAVIAELGRLRQEIQVIISSFSVVQLEMFHALAPQYPIGVLFTEQTVGADWLSVLQACGATYVHLEDTPRLNELMKLPLAAGYSVNVWTVDSRSRANELLNLGATGIFTNVADQMLDLGTVA